MEGMWSAQAVALVLASALVTSRAGGRADRSRHGSDSPVQAAWDACKPHMLAARAVCAWASHEIARAAYWHRMVIIRQDHQAGTQPDLQRFD